MGYSHTQRGRWHVLFYVVALLCATSTVVIGDDGARWVLMPATALFVFLGLCFSYLRIEDEGEWLHVRFGPIPLLGKRIRYADIVSASEGRSRWIDGWGIHWIPGRGWTYNLWGFSCVELELRGCKRVRLGTDDAAELAEFVRSRITTA